MSNVSELVLGIDEAGRGPALGPMVLALVALTPTTSRRLTRAGVVDSKHFGAGDVAHERRQDLATQIRDCATHVDLEVCDVSTIDAYVRRGALNVLERERAHALIDRAPEAKRIVADGKRMFAPLRNQFPHLQAFDRGESRHVAVAAASVLAKVERDRLFLEISARYADEFGPLRGRGYVNAGTRDFVHAFHGRYGHLPPEARTSWPWPGIRLPEDEAAATTEQLGFSF